MRGYAVEEIEEGWRRTVGYVAAVDRAHASKVARENGMLGDRGLHRYEVREVLAQLRSGRRAGAP